MKMIKHVNKTILSKLPIIGILLILSSCSSYSLLGENYKLNKGVIEFGHEYSDDPEVIIWNPAVPKDMSLALNEIIRSKEDVIATSMFVVSGIFDKKLTKDELTAFAKTKKVETVLFFVFRDVNQLVAFQNKIPLEYYVSYETIPDKGSTAYIAVFLAKRK